MLWNSEKNASHFCGGVLKKSERLGGGFKHFLFLPLFGEDFRVD